MANSDNPRYVIIWESIWRKRIRMGKVPTAMISPRMHFPGVRNIDFLVGSHGLRKSQMVSRNSGIPNGFVGLPDATCLGYHKVGSF